MDIVERSRMMSKRVDRDQIGRVLSDSERFGATNCEIAIDKGTIARGTYVRIEGEGGRFYVGQIIDGPYYFDGETGSNDPTYMVRLNTVVAGDVQRAVMDRPKPKAPVYVLERGLVEKFLGVAGDMTVGRLANQELVQIGLDSDTLTRHVGIFGTTGSGKSNTIQVVMEEASKVGFSILVFDVEGEYVEMDRPTDKLQELLTKFGLKPTGVQDLTVYVPQNCKSRRSNAVSFGVSFENVDLHVFGEVAGLNSMEYIYFLDLIEKVKAVAPAFREMTLKAVLHRLRGRLQAQVDNPTLPSHVAEAHTTLYSKLTIIEGLGIIDTAAKPINVADVLTPKKISVIDLSDASDPVKNIVIADFLDKLFKHKLADPNTPKVLVALEEAHTFIRIERREQMMATLVLLLELARRGRKRGICLNIITQQPARLPPELLELCNTRIMHRMSSTTNIDVLKQSTGNVPESFWDTLPSLGKGEALIASPRYAMAVISQIRPVTSRRLKSE